MILLNTNTSTFCIVDVMIETIKHILYMQGTPGDHLKQTVVNDEVDINDICISV